eukprot:7391046-Prymnesium_polylepis.2
MSRTTAHRRAQARAQGRALLVACASIGQAKSALIQESHFPAISRLRAQLPEENTQSVCPRPCALAQTRAHRQNMLRSTLLPLATLHLLKSTRTKAPFAASGAAPSAAASGSSMPPAGSSGE